MSDTTVGIDIGTTSIKAVAVDGTGTVVRRCRRPHDLRAPSAAVFEHDAGAVWRESVLAAWQEVSGNDPIAAVTVSAMVPSMCGVDAAGIPVTAGLLYGDGRGAGIDDSGTIEGEAAGFARWLAANSQASAFWPAQAVANAALCGTGVIDSSTAMSMAPLHDGRAWSEELCGSIGVRSAQLPQVAAGTAAAGERNGTRVSGGTIDALAEQIVADARAPGDVLVICGTTLIPWALTSEPREVAGLWTIPYTVRDVFAIGGASNAGGLFIDRVRTMTGSVDPAEIESVAPGAVPVWLPYIRGERTPLHDPSRRAELLDVDVGHGPASIQRAAYEAAGFVVRHHLELADTSPRRIVAVGGGVRSASWMQALADTTALPVDVSAVADGAAIGAAFMARVTAGLEADTAGGRAWARTDRRVEPRADWLDPCSARYERFLEGTRR